MQVYFTEHFFDLIPYLLSLGLTFSLAVFTFRRGAVLGARPFFYFLLVELVQITGFIFEIISPTLSGKMFWDNFQWFTSLLFSVFALNFTLAYIGKTGTRVAFLILILALGSIIICTMIVLDLLPGQGIIDPVLITGPRYPLYEYEFGPLIYAAILYAYIIMLASIVILAREFFRQQDIYRLQTLFILTGISVPVILSFLTFAGVTFLSNRDITPITLAFGNLVVAFSLFRYQVFDIIPIARTSVMDYSTDPIVVLDGLDVIAEVNSAFEDLVGQPKRLLLRKTIQQFLPSLRKLDESLQSAPQLEESMLLNREPERYFEVGSKPFKNRLGIYGGRLLILHDVTRRKLDQTELRTSHGVLEQRVREHTIDLEKTNLQLTQEISERKRAEQEKAAYAQELEILYQMAVEISELPASASLEEFITQKLKDLTQAIFVALTEYNPGQKQLEVRRLIINHKPLERTMMILGMDPYMLKIPVSQEIYQKLMQNEVGYFTDLSEATYGAISPEIAARLRTEFKVDQFLVLGILYNGELEAAMLLILPGEGLAPGQRFLKALANLAAIAFWRKKSEQARQDSETRFQQMAELLPQGIFECDPDGYITYANKQAAIMLRSGGYSPGDHFLDLIGEDEKEQMLETFRLGKSGVPSKKHEFMINRMDGSRFPALVYSSPVIRNGEHAGMRGVFVDITEIKQVEDNLQRSNRFLRATSRCNMALVHATDPRNLFNEICHILIEEIGYTFSWIGFVSNKNIAMRAMAVSELINIKDLPIPIARQFSPDECQPLMDALQQKAPVVVNQTYSDPRCRIWLGEASPEPFKAMICLPLIYADQLFGGLMVYTNQCEGFLADEISLLQEMASDLSFGIHTLNVRDDRDKAIARLEEVNRKLTEAYDMTLQGLSNALELREREIAGHSQRVVRMTLLLAEKMGVAGEKLTNMRWGAYLHDIGKIGIPDSILLKPSGLTEDEWAVMRQHPVYAFRLVSPISFLKDAIEIPYLHHERWNGSGYPNHLRGEAIPLAARIFAVIDVWDALINDRPYRPAWSREETLSFLKKNSGTLFDPAVVQNFIELIETGADLK